MVIYRIQNKETKLFHCAGRRDSKLGKIFSGIGHVKTHLRIRLHLSYFQLKHCTIHRYDLESMKHTEHDVLMEDNEIVIL